MISRRESFKVFASGAAMGLTGALIVSTTSCVPTEAPAVETDPTFAAIGAHKAAWAHWLSLDDDERDRLLWRAASDAETAAFEAVCDIVPTTLAGVVAMSGYIGQFCLTDLPPDGTAIHRAFLTISQAVARVEYRSGRTSS